jgi:hypothetical protein
MGNEARQDKITYSTVFGKRFGKRHYERAKHKRKIDHKIEREGLDCIQITRNIIKWRFL